MSNNTETMNRLMDQILLQSQPKCVAECFSSLIASCGSNGVTFDAAAAVEYWWTLARLGVVAIPGEQLAVVGPRIPRLILTERGRKWIERGEESPHDPPKYLAAVRRRVESPDETVMAYLDEAVGAWFHGLYRASAVMLGCACERLVLMLADEIIRADVPPWSARIGKKLKGARVGVSQVFDDVRDCLTQLANENKLPGALGDAIDRKLSPVFEHARGLRNKAGHPTKAEVTSEDAEGSLFFFPGFYALVSDLCKCLRSGKPSGASA